MKPIVAAAVAAFALGALGCTPTPEKVCNHLQELADKDTPMPGDKPFHLSMSKCLKNMNELKERDAEAYKCTAKLVTKLSTLNAAFTAISVCDKNKPKKSSSDDDDDTKSSKDDDSSSKKKKSKKSSDDE